MQQADIVLYYRLVAPAILDLVRKDAERQHVDKSLDRHPLPQRAINELLACQAGQAGVAAQGAATPSSWGEEGRGGEEIDTLSAHGIPLQVVPGIAAAARCGSYASYAVIPLSHRDYAHSRVFVAGHLQDGSDDQGGRGRRRHPVRNKSPAQYAQPQKLHIDGDGLARLHDGLEVEVQQGTTARQRVFTGTLESLPGIVVQEDVEPPTLAIVGEVVRLHPAVSR